MLIVMYVMDFRKWGAPFLRWGDVSVLAELHFFFPDMNVKHGAQILFMVLTARPPNQTQEDCNCFVNKYYFLILY